jgi:hypothetical protein
MAVGIRIAVDLLACTLIFLLGMYAGHRLSGWLAERIPAELLPEQSRCAPPPKRPPPPASPRTRISEFAPKPKFKSHSFPRTSWPQAREAAAPSPVVYAPQKRVHEAAATGRDLLPQIKWEKDR